MQGENQSRKRETESLRKTIEELKREILELKKEKERGYKPLGKREIKRVKNKVYDSSSTSEIPSYTHPQKKESAKPAKDNGRGRNTDRGHEEKIRRKKL